jgi:hypothetical protein
LPQSFTAVLRAQVLFEPRGGEAGDLLEGARFFEEMRGARNYLQFFLAPKPSKRLLIQLDDRLIPPADYQEGRRFDASEGGACQIGTSAARYDSSDLFSKLGGSNQRGPGSGACAEETGSQALRLRHLRDEPRCVNESIRKQVDVESQMASGSVYSLFFSRQ